MVSTHAYLPKIFASHKARSLLNPQSFSLQYKCKLFARCIHQSRIRRIITRPPTASKSGRT